MLDFVPPQTFRKGDVVLVAFPYTQIDGKSATKRRPAVIVSGNRMNNDCEDVLLVPLTTTESGNYGKPTTIKIAMDSSEGRKAGLRLDSIVECTVIATMPKTMIVSKLGALSAQFMQKVDDCIKSVLEMEN